MTHYLLDKHDRLENRQVTLLKVGDDGQPDWLTIGANGILEQTTFGLSALRLEGNTHLWNSGQIRGSAGWFAVEMNGNAWVENLSGGVIQGDYGAIAVSTAGSVIMNFTNAYILGGVAGIMLRSVNTYIENAGVISGQVAIHALENAAPGQYFYLNNSGSVISTAAGPGAYAIRINQAKFGDIYNAGYIKGAIQNSAAIVAQVYNIGVIDGDIYLGTPGGRTDYIGGTGRVNGTVYAVGGESYFTGGNYTDRFVGGDGYDSVSGGGGNDVLNGGGGINRFDGGSGGDNITSGGSEDRFIYTDVSDSTSGAGADTLRGFDLLDMIDLRGVDGAAARRFIGVHAFFTDGTFQVRSVRTSTNAHTVYVDVDGDAVLDMTIYVRGQSALLYAGNFLL